MVRQFDERFPEAAMCFKDAEADILAFPALPVANWKQVWSNNPLARLNKEVMWRALYGHLLQPHGSPSVDGRVLAEQHDGWEINSRYLVAPVLDVGNADRLEDPMLTPAGAA